jgi:hypothetical protein
MRVLFHVEPLVMHSRPFHYWAWLGRAAAMARALERTGRGHGFRFLLNAALAERAVAPAGGREGGPAAGHGLPAEWVVALRQDEVRRHFNAPNIAILDGFHRGAWPAEKVTACGHAVRERLGGFVPDVVVTFTPAPHLAAAFPGALVLHAENGMFSRHPFPGTQYLDPLGVYARSVPGVHGRELAARRATPEERAWLDGVREAHRAWLTAASPFHALERSMRRRFRRLALLPLQFGGEAGFDLNGPFRNQGEYLLHVLERLPGGLGLIVTEHATARWLGDALDDETRAWVRERWPQVTWVEPHVAPHASQALVLHVDDVIGLSSSVGLQALYWRKPLVTVGWSHLRAFAAAEGVEHLDAARVNGGADRDGAVAWLLRHYFVPEVLCLHDGAWLGGFLARALERHAAGVRGLGFFDPVADDPTLARLYAPPAPPVPPREVDPAVLLNGGFDRWRPGNEGREQPLHWVVVSPPAAAGTVSRGDPGDGPREPGGDTLACVCLERTAAGEQPTLLLQRVPDLDRLAGALVTLEFWARGAPGTTLAVWLYQQFGVPDGPPQGTPARTFVLDGTWRLLAYTARVPEAPESPRGAAHHTEVVFALPPGGPSRVELAGVTLGPGRLDA